MTLFFFSVCSVDKRTCKYTDVFFFYALLICSGEGYPLTMIIGSVAALKESDGFIGVSFLEGERRRRGKVGFLHMCITNIGQKNLSTNEGFTE